MNSKSPLESLQRHASILAVGCFLVCQTMAVAFFDADSVLKRESDVNFFALYDEVGPNVSQKPCGISAGSAPSEGRTQGQTAPTSLVDTPAIQEFHPVERAAVDHGKLNGESVDGRYGTRILDGLVDGHTAFSIEQSSEVSVVVIHQGPRKISGELGGHPMPGPVKGAEGQYRTKQESFGSLGVCNEQVLDPKGKVCSELMGNHESEAETTSSCVESTTQGNRFDYHKTTNAPVRFVRPGPQGNVADLTWESLEYMGRPWYWDRQCPTGRAYFIRKDDSHMVVDPRFLFEWTGPLTYPDQMAFTRLCGVRFFFRHERRMFQAVIDGVTA